MSANGAKMLMADALAVFERRLKAMGIWWRAKGVVNGLVRLCRDLENSGEDAQIRTLALRANHMHAYVGYDKAGSDDEGCWFLLADVNEVCHTVLEDTCSLCQKKGAEARKCPLQRALRSMTTLADTKEIDGCIFKPYSDAAYYGLLDEEEKEDKAI